MTSNQEYVMMDIYNKVHSDKKLLTKWNKQIKKMNSQDKHKYKNVCEQWEYALYRIQGGKSKEKY
jgi:hypothetical protein